MEKETNKRSSEIKRKPSSSNSNNRRKKQGGNSKVKTVFTVFCHKHFFFFLGKG